MGSKSFSAGTRDSSQQALSGTGAPLTARQASLGETLDRGFVRRGISAGALSKDGSEPSAAMPRSSNDDTGREPDAGAEPSH